MFDYLIDHALKNVWCTPNQDRQTIIQLARLTPINGVWNIVDVLWRTITLPEQATRFHVYQIGQIYPALLGLLDSDTDVWVPFSEACTKESLIVDIYNSNGIQLPRSQVWYMVTKDKDLIVAIKEQKKIPFDLKIESVFLRVYSNAYFNSEESSPLNDYIEVVGKTIKTTNDILELQNKITLLKAQAGGVYCFVNGFYTPDINMLTTAVGDIAEYIYDSSIYKVVDFFITDLKTFTSVLDKKNKYLLHYSDANDGDIDYHDDIDFFLINTDEKGVYYHRNNQDSIRMITHKDYSIAVPYIVGYSNNVNIVSETEKITIRMHIRKSGYHRNLVNENSRIKELYKLPDELITKALLGINSNVDVWTAANLEMSGYTEIMRSEINDVTRALVEKAYGYNAISKLIADTPMVTNKSADNNTVVLPYNLINNSTIYEYDANGVMLDYYQHPYGTNYNPWISNTVMVEGITGLGGPYIDDNYGDVTSTIESGLEYRMYTCPIIGGVPTNRWVDITGNKDYYSIQNNKVVWNVDHGSEYVLVRSNKRFLAYDVYLDYTDGLLSFDITEDILINGNRVSKTMTVPMGELVIFLNGHSLIEKIDYVVNYPKVVITNKKFLSNPLIDKQRISVRFTGFCNSDLSRNVSTDIGFIEHKMLSHNNKFDIRDDKVNRIIVGGAAYMKNELLFSEDSSGVTVPDALNGVPYSISDIVVPLRGLAVSDTYDCRNKSVVIDKTVSDYLTLWKPEKKLDSLNVIQELYAVVSPFCCKIIYDLKSGLINDDILKHYYTDSEVIDICKKYEYLLAFDQTQDNNKLDTNYVVVHPHNLNTVIDIDIYSYKFLARVVKLYMNNLIDINHFVSVSVY